VFDVMGLQNESQAGVNTEVMDGLMDIILGYRQQFRADKNWAASDELRDRLTELGIQVKDGKDGANWSLN
ncbi:MAG: cysteine--tRNA ligase, partial [Bacteroidota bacterium]